MRSDPIAPSWSQLGALARAWRAIHAGWSVAQLACLGLIWVRVVQRRRDPAVWAAAAFLAAEGGGLAIGRGDCPMGRVQEAWGDPVPFFELLLPPRAAKAAVPVLAVVGVTAIAGLVLRAPGLVLRARPRPAVAGIVGFHPHRDEQASRIPVGMVPGRSAEGSDAEVAVR